MGSAFGRVGKFLRGPGLLGYAGLGLGAAFLVNDIVQERRRRMEQIQDIRMTPVLAAQGRAMQQLGLAQGEGAMFRMGALADQARFGNTITPQEAELSALMGQTGAVAAQRAAVAPQLDEIALNHVLQMT